MALGEAMPVACEITFEACPCCGHRLNASVDLDVGGLHTPRPGDITVCMYCGKVLEFGDALELVPANLEVLDAVDRGRIDKALEDLVAAMAVVERQAGAR